jgi:uncharacterized protein (TIGR04551 family)
MSRRPFAPRDGRLTGNARLATTAMPAPRDEHPENTAHRPSVGTPRRQGAYGPGVQCVVPLPAAPRNEGHGRAAPPTSPAAPRRPHPHGEGECATTRRPPVPLPAACSLVVAALLLPALASASGLQDYGNELMPGEPAGVRLSGYFRLRGEALDNLDLSRGPTPSGRALFPQPLSEPTASLLTAADGRLRTDIVAQGPGGGVAAVARIDWLDNVQLGSTPFVTPGFGTSPTPAATPGQVPSVNAKLRFAYGVASTPVGILTAGRMGAHWGLGMMANSGDCSDCDGADAADRVAFVTPLLQHVFAVAYDWSATGPFTSRKDGRRVVDLDPSDDVRTVTFAVFQPHDAAALRRRSAAGKWTWDYGLSAAYRWQDKDVPATYLNLATQVDVDASQVMSRGYQAFSTDAWARVVAPTFRVEGEAALLLGRVAQPSLVPGLLLDAPVTSVQWGFALESDFGEEDAPWHFGLDTGAASGDSAPGFGAFPAAGAQAVPGELDAPQANPPRDTTANNFRFNPDYRVDRILFRELLGTVTDAAYVKPWVSWRPLRLTSGTLSFHEAAVGSMALFPSSTPSGEAPLGVELDSTVRWESRDGFRASLEHAVLFPLSGLDNPALGLKAQPAQSLRLRVTYAF